MLLSLRLSNPLPWPVVQPAPPWAGVGEVTSKMEEGQTVEFDVTEGEKGPQAANVRLVGQ